MQKQENDIFLIYVEKALEFLMCFDFNKIENNMSFENLMDRVSVFAKKEPLVKGSTFYHLYDNPHLYKNLWGYFPDIGELKSPVEAFGPILAARKYDKNEYQYFVKLLDGTNTLTVFENTRPVIFKQTKAILPNFNISQKRYNLIVEYLNKYCLYKDLDGLNKVGLAVEVGENFIKIKHKEGEKIINIEGESSPVVYSGFSIEEIRKKTFKVV